MADNPQAMVADLVFDNPVVDPSQWQYPCDEAAEKAILAGILSRNELYSAAATLSPDDFTLSAHGRLFAAISDMCRANRPVDLITLTDELCKRGTLQTVGGVAYLTDLIDGLWVVKNIAHYVNIVKDKANLRRLMQRAETVMRRASAPGARLDDVAGYLQEEITALGQLSGATNWDLIPNVLELPEASTLWLVPGIVPLGGVTLLAGESGIGKTWLGLSLGAAVAHGWEWLGGRCQQANVLYLDRENPLAIVQRRLKLIAPAADHDRFRVWGTWVGEPAPLIGDHRLLVYARELKPLIIFDSLIRFHNADENQASEMRYVMQHLRRLADAGATVVVLHHKAKNEQSKYRGSSDIMAAVDVVISLRRDEQVVVASCIKNRLGPEFSFTLQPDFASSGTFKLVESSIAVRQQERVHRLVEVIGNRPGLTQNEVVAEAGLSRAEAIKLLDRHVGHLWVVERGSRNSKLYFLRGAKAPFQPAHGAVPLVGTGSEQCDQ